MDGQTPKIGNSTITNASCDLDCQLYQISISPTIYIYIYIYIERFYVNSVMESQNTDLSRQLHPAVQHQWCQHLNHDRQQHRPAPRRKPGVKPIAPSPTNPTRVCTDFLVFGKSNTKDIAGMLRESGCDAVGMSMSEAGMLQVAEVAEKMARTIKVPKCVFVHALDIDISEPTSMYARADKMVSSLVSSYPKSSIIISGLPTYRDHHRNALATQLTTYIKHKTASSKQVCLMDNLDLNLRDHIHFTARAKKALCNRLLNLKCPALE